jgi:hypothetical protein
MTDLIVVFALWIMFLLGFICGDNFGDEIWERIERWTGDR